MSKERPLLMRPEMAKASLARTKTQTRRAMNPQPIHEVESCTNGWYQADPGASSSGNTPFGCPYGKPGDLLWVKETHWRWGRWVRNGLTKRGKPAWRFKVVKRQDRPFEAAFEDLNDPPLRKTKSGWNRTQLGWHKRPSIFMPRRASRLILEIVSVRVQRLQDISEEDAKAEGVPSASYYINPLTSSRAAYSHVKAFRGLWESINGKGSWNKNPYVWVVEFRKV